MICFGYLKLTFNISVAFIRHECRLCICARATFAHALPIIMNYTDYKHTHCKYDQRNCKCL